MKCAAPCRQSACRSLVRKDATIIRARLCMNPSDASCRMPASTTGNPVWPSCQACRPALSSRHCRPRSRMSRQAASDPLLRRRPLQPRQPGPCVPGYIIGHVDRPGPGLARGPDDGRYPLAAPDDQAAAERPQPGIQVPQ